MADRFSSAARDRVMSRIKQRDTAPEMALWRALWAAGLRYRLKLLPAARIRTNPVSLNGGVERAPPAR